MGLNPTLVISSANWRLSISQIHRREEVVLLANALEKLPANYREVFIRDRLQSVSFEDIAARLGRSPHAVRLLWGRAVVKLSQVLEQPP